MGPKRQGRKMIFEVVFPTTCAYYRKLEDALRAAGGLEKRINAVPRSAVRELGVAVLS